MQDLGQHIKQLKEEFRSIGARVRIVAFTPGSSFFKNELLEVNVTADSHGQYFEILADRKAASTLKITLKHTDSVPYHIVLSSEDGKSFLCGIADGELFVMNLASARNDKFSAAYGKSNTQSSFGSFKPGRPVTRLSLEQGSKLLQSILLKKAAGKAGAF